MKLKLTKTLSLVTVFAFSLILPKQGLAQAVTPDLNLTIFPPTAYLMVKPGANITHRVLLKYEGKVRVNILPELVDFKTDGLTGTPVIQKPSQLDYITLQNPDRKLGEVFTLEPGAQVELVLMINPPIHAQRAEYPLSLVLTAVPDTTVVFDGGSAQASGAVASNVILSVQDDLDNKGELHIEKIKLPKIIDSFSSINFSTLVKNLGRNGVAAKGEITLKHGWSGKELQKWHIYPDVVLANSSREIRALNQDPDELNPDEEIIFIETSYKPPFLIGPYEVTVDLSSANQSNQSLHQRTQTVIALPFSIIALLGFGVGLYVFIYRINKKQQITF